MTPSRRITPTAVLVLPVDASKEEWLATRREGITATDMPKILGLSDYGTAIDVWMDKVSPSEDTFIMEIGEGEAALWGTVLEDTVARTWADSKGWSVRRIGVIAHEDEPWIRASLDRLVHGCPDGRCGVEVKTRSGYVAKAWEEAVPADVTVQVEWQLITSGLDHIHVIALIGGQKLAQHIIQQPTAERRKELIDTARIVWDSVGTGDAPKMPATVWTDDYLNQLHPEHEGSVEIDTTTLVTATAYQDLTQQITLLEDKKKALRTQLIGAIGDAEAATMAGVQIYTYKASSTRRLDAKKLAAKYPQAAKDEDIHNTTTTRTLRVSSSKEDK